MDPESNSRAGRFLVKFRQLEGMLEKRYAGRQTSSGSVVKEYLRDPDSEPWRADLDLCREIRNLLSHNVDNNGIPVVEPSEDILSTLDAIIHYVMRPQMAVDYGTPAEKIMFAHPNDMVLDILRHMLKRGYSHVPVADRSGLVGVFSAGSLVHYVTRVGLDDVGDELRIGELKGALDFGDERSEKYMFLREDATLLTVKDAFEKRSEKNSRLAVVFLTSDGTRHGDVVAMLTPWDVLGEDAANNQRES